MNQNNAFSISSCSSSSFRNISSINSSNNNSNSNKNSDSEKEINKADKIDSQNLNRGNSEPPFTITDQNLNKIKSQQQHPHLQSAHSVPTTQISENTTGIITCSERLKRIKPKSVSLSISPTISTTDQLVNTNFSPPFTPNQHTKSSASSLNNFLFFKFTSLTTNTSTVDQINQSDQLNQQPNKKTKKRRSFELFNSGIIRRQHSAQQSSQSSPGPASNSQSDQRRESISSAKQTNQQLPLSIISTGQQPVANQGVGGGSAVTTQIDPSTSNQTNQINQVVSSSGSAVSTPATTVSQVASRVGFARRFLNRSKTSGLLFGSSSLADQNRPHSRTVTELFRGEMSVRRPRGSFRNSLHRFGSSEATLRRPVRHHAWAFKDGEWYIAYGM